MALTKTIRFEIFKRDNFTCQYCGKKPPEVMLEIDHILSISNGGTDDMNNLITSCFNCNRGKGKIILDKLPSSLIENLEVIKEQRKQTKQYYKFLEEIEQQKENNLREIGCYFYNKWAKTKQTQNKYIFGGNWRVSIKYFLKTFNKYEIIDAIDIAFSKISKRGIPEQSDVFRYMCGILHKKRKEKGINCGKEKE